MNKYISYFKMRMKKEKYYRANLFGLFITSAFGLVIQILLWKAIYNDVNDLSGITFNAMFSYIVFGMLHRKFMGNGVENSISNSFRNGNISIEYMRPQNYFARLLFEDLGRGTLHLFAMSIPVICFYAFIPTAPRIEIYQIIYFAFSSVIAYILYFQLSYIIGVSSIWLGTSIGFSILKESLFLLLGGGLIPVDFYPIWFQNIVNLLPFKYMYYLPLAGFLETESSFMLLLALAWLMILSVICYILTKRSEHRLVVQGG